MRYPFFRSATALLLLLSAVTLVGCSRDNPVEPEIDVSGTYALATVAGEEIPMLFFQDSEVTVELVSGSVNLAANGTFQETLIFRETAVGAEEGEIIELETAGTYSANGPVVNFMSPEGGWDGSIGQGTITYVIWNVPFTFRR
jgi:hypothetical protein